MPLSLHVLSRETAAIVETVVVAEDVIAVAVITTVDVVVTDRCCCCRGRTLSRIFHNRHCRYRCRCRPNETGCRRCGIWEQDVQILAASRRSPLHCRRRSKFWRYVHVRSRRLSRLCWRSRKRTIYLVSTCILATIDLLVRAIVQKSTILYHAGAEVCPVTLSQPFYRFSYLVQQFATAPNFQNYCLSPSSYLHATFTCSRDIRLR